MLPYTSLNAATSTGPGVSRDLEDSVGRHTLHVLWTGSPTSLDVDLQGSMDGTNWFTLQTVVLAGSNPVTANHVVRYVRANVRALSGGTSPTVTATIASA